MGWVSCQEDIFERYEESSFYNTPQEPQYNFQDFNTHNNPIKDKIDKIISKINYIISEIKGKTEYGEIIKEKQEEIKKFKDNRCIDEHTFYTIKKLYFEIIFLSIVKNNRYDISKINELNLSNEQNKYVELNNDGYFRIIGASGTGKTVILLKRAVRIAKEKEKKIVRIFTANKSLAAYIDTLSQKIYSSNNLYCHDIYSFFQKALEILECRGYNFTDLNRAKEIANNNKAKQKQSSKLLDRVRNIVYLETISDPFEKKYTYESWHEFLKKRKITLNDYPLNQILESKNIKNVLIDVGKLNNNNWDKDLYSIFCSIIKEDLNDFKVDDKLLKEFKEEIIKNEGKNYSYEKILYNRLNKFLNYDADIENFLREEISYCRSFATYNDYIEHTRTGRKVSLTKKERLMIIYIAEDWHDWLIAGEISDEEKICKDLERNLRDTENLKKIRERLSTDYVLIDEIQDIPQIAIKILLSLVPERKNFFFTGDLRQKTKISSVRLKNLGLDFRGKSFILQKNYRNTKAILEAAHFLIKNFTIPENDEIEIIDPQYSNYSGVKPIVFNIDHFKNNFTHQNFIVENVKLRLNVVKSIAVVSENKKIIREVVDLLEREKIIYKEIQPNETAFLMDNNDAKIFLSDMASVKGYEFDSVIIADMSDSKFPTKNSNDPELWREITKLYVAMTRARDELIFTYEGKKSYIFDYFEDKVDYVIIK
ncbi:MAG: UvrD-helicase domain-containing protein [Elusimicrobiales bacterium]|nr:UvrD-helicase domain-containing protein [Elusimicrobiales bacterium]